MLLTFVKLIIFILLASALVTPPVYYLLSITIPVDVMWPYSRIYDRVALAVLIIGLCYYRKQFQLATLKTDFLLWQEKKKWRKFFVGFLIAFIPVLFVLPWMVAQGDLSWRVLSTANYFERIIRLIPTIFVVSFLEELVFRVFIFWTLYKSFGLLRGLVLSSIFYAVVHFIAPVKTFHVEGYDFVAGFHYYYVVAERILSFDLVSALIVLISIGIFLALLLKQTRSLFLCAGFHGGWIASIKVTKYFANITEVGVDRLREQYFLLTFSETWLAIIITAIFAYSLFFRKKIWNC